MLDWLRPGGTRPRAAVFFGLALGLIGLALLIGPDVVAIRGAGGVNLWAALVPVFGSLFWALGSIVSRYAPRPSSSQLATGMQMLAGGVAFLAVAVVSGEARQFDVRAVAASSLVGFFYLVTFGSLLGFTAYIYLLGATTPAKVATYAYVNPVIAVILGWAVAGEPFTSRTMLAAAVILGGVAIITLANVPGAARSPATPRRCGSDEHVARQWRTMRVFARTRQDADSSL